LTDADITGAEFRGVKGLDKARTEKAKGLPH